MNAPSEANNSFSSQLQKNARAAREALSAAKRRNNVSYYPRRDSGAPIPIEVAIKEIKRGLHSLTFKDLDKAKHHLDQVKASYNEVKAATEYQDQKAARLLTIMSFLTAAAGAFFAKFIDLYPLDATGRDPDFTLPIAGIYILFAVYFVLVAVGALTVFRATQTRFVFPEKTGAAKKKIDSLVFFKPISCSDPTAWGNEFSKPTIILLREYIENYVVETYLIAAKTSNKLRLLQPAQNILQVAIWILLALILSLAFTLSLIPRDAQKKIDSQPPGTMTIIYNVP